MYYCSVIRGILVQFKYPCIFLLISRNTSYIVIRHISVDIQSMGYYSQHNGMRHQTQFILSAFRCRYGAEWNSLHEHVNFVVNLLELYESKRHKIQINKDWIQIK
jgi:hypothetical protein